MKVTIHGHDNTEMAFKQATQAAAIFGAAITAALGVAAKQAIEFNKGLAEIQTLLGASAGPAVAKMGKNMLELSRSSGEALDSLTKARYDIISAGFTGAAESAEVLSGSVRLAQGGLVEAADAADLVTTALRGLGLQADQTVRVTDVLFTTVRLGKTTMTELTASLGPVFAMAKIARVSLEEVGAAMAQITAAGINTTQSSTALLNLLRSLAAPSKEAGRELGALGITLKNGLGPALEALGKAGDESLESLARLIPNIRALKAASAASDISVFNNNLRAMKNSMGASTEAAQIMRDTVVFGFKQLRQEFEALSVELFDQLLPALRLLADVGKANLQLFSSLHPVVKTIIVSFTALLGVTALLAAAFGALGMAISNAGIAMSGFKKSSIASALSGMLKSMGKLVKLTSAWSVLLVGATVAAGLELIALAAAGTAKNLKAATANMQKMVDVADELPQLKMIEVADGVFRLGKEASVATRMFRNLGTEVKTIAGIASNSVAADFLSGKTLFGHSGVTDGIVAIDTLKARAELLAGAFKEIQDRTAAAGFQFQQLLGTAPSDFRVMADALMDVSNAGTGFKLINGELKVASDAAGPFAELLGVWRDRLKEIEDEMPGVAVSVETLTLSVRGVEKIYKDAAKTIRDFAAEAKLAAIAPELGDMPELVLPRAPEVLGEFTVAVQEAVKDMQAVAQDALQGTFAVFGDSVADSILGVQSFSEAFTEGFKSLKGAIIAATVELLTMRAVMAGLKALSGFGGPIGKVAGFFLSNTGTDFAPVRGATGFASVPGTPGLDGTPALLSGGETVLTRRSSGLMRKALRIPQQGENRILPSLRVAGGGSVVVGLASGLLRTEAAEIDDRLIRLQKRRGGRT